MVAEIETSLAVRPAGLMPMRFDRDQIELIKTQIAPGLSDGELALFVEVARKRGLDPFAKQIYAIRRRVWLGDHEEERMSIQTGIDGFRLIARRAGLVAIDETEFTYDPEARADSNPLGLVKATVSVWPRKASRPTVASAYWDEYRQTTRKGLAAKWKDMPRTMLGKCAEALALRRAFPEELSGLYVAEEMDQADSAPVAVERRIPAASKPVESPAAPASTPPAPDAVEERRSLGARMRAAAAVLGEARAREIAGSPPAAGTQRTLEDLRAIVDRLEATIATPEEVVKPASAPTPPARGLREGDVPAGLTLEELRAAVHALGKRPGYEARVCEDQYGCGLADVGPRERAEILEIIKSEGVQS